MRRQSYKLFVDGAVPSLTTKGLNMKRIQLIEEPLSWFKKNGFKMGDTFEVVKEGKDMYFIQPDGHEETGWFKSRFKEVTEYLPKELFEL